MPKKKDLSQTTDNNNLTQTHNEENHDELILGDLDIGLNDDDLLITTEETLTIITEEDEGLLEDEEFLLGSNKKKNKKNLSEDDEMEDFDNYFYQEE